MNTKSILLTLFVVICGAVIAGIFVKHEAENQTGDLAQIEATPIAQANDLETPVDLRTTPSEIPVEKSQEESESSEKQLAEFEGQEYANEAELVESLVEVFGVGVAIPMDKAAQDRLFAKVSNTREKEVREQYRKAEYDPAYDASWPTDMQIKAHEELSNHFAENASIDKYECVEGQCSLKISFGVGKNAPLTDSSEFMTSLKSSPSIIKSGMKRDVLLREIGVDEESNGFVDYVIGEVDSADGNNKNEAVN